MSYVPEPASSARSYESASVAIFALGPCVRSYRGAADTGIDLLDGDVVPWLPLAWFSGRNCISAGVATVHDCGFFCFLPGQRSVASIELSGNCARYSRTKRSWRENGFAFVRARHLVFRASLPNRDFACQSAPSYGATNAPLFMRCRRFSTILVRMRLAVRLACVAFEARDYRSRDAIEARCPFFFCRRGS